MPNRFLMESALLGQGLSAIRGEELAAAWPGELCAVAWVEAGKIVIGGMERFLPFRNGAGTVARIDCKLLQKAMDTGLSGVLTASGTMEACRMLGLPLAVSCGMGGIDAHRGGRLCPDLPALREIPVTLLATAFKDMIDTPATLGWLRGNGVRILGVGTDRCTGYLFHSADEALDGLLESGPLPGPSGKLLLLHPIPMGERIEEEGLMDRAVAAGLAAEAGGRYYHPAVNGYLDEKTSGRAARIQLAALIRNGLLARELTAY